MKKTLIGVTVAGLMVLGSPLAANAQYGNGYGYGDGNGYGYGDGNG